MMAMLAPFGGLFLCRFCITQRAATTNVQALRVAALPQHVAERLCLSGQPGSYSEPRLRLGDLGRFFQEVSGEAEAPKIKLHLTESRRLSAMLLRPSRASPLLAHPARLTRRSV